MVVGFQMHTACKDQAIEKNRKGHEVGPRRRALQRAEAQTGLYRTSKAMRHRGEIEQLPHLWRDDDDDATLSNGGGLGPAACFWTRPPMLTESQIIMIT
jgi:hypothetical protein